MAEGLAHDIELGALADLVRGELLATASFERDAERL